MLLISRRRPHVGAKAKELDSNASFSSMESVSTTTFDMPSSSAALTIGNEWGSGGTCGTTYWITPGPGLAFWEARSHRAHGPAGLPAVVGILPFPGQKRVGWMRDLLHEERYRRR
jgi:hypothetical protein